MSLRFALVASLFAVTLLAAPPVFAKKEGHGNKHDAGSMEQEESGKGAHKGQESHGKADNDDHIAVTFHFDDIRRDQVRSYLRESYGSNCPPGLAKKRNGCLPPGQAKKYRIGGMLPHGYEPVPHGLFSLMGPPPAGTFYAMVDKDVVLASEATKKILDAVTLLSAME